MGFWTWDPTTIQVHASSWGRVSSSKGGGNTAVSQQRGCRNSCKIKVASSPQHISLMALGTRQAAGFKPQVLHWVISLFLYAATSISICWLSFRFRLQALQGRKHPFASCCTSFNSTNSKTSRTCWALLAQDCP